MANCVACADSHKQIKKHKNVCVCVCGVSHALGFYNATACMCDRQLFKLIQSSTPTNKINWQLIKAQCKQIASTCSHIPTTTAIMMMALLLFLLFSDIDSD